MPFVSLRQARAAFSGALGPKMKESAPEFASKTDYKDLPTTVRGTQLRRPDPRPAPKHRSTIDLDKPVTLRRKSVTPLHTALLGGLAHDKYK